MRWTLFDSTSRNAQLLGKNYLYTQLDEIPVVPVRRALSRFPIAIGITGTTWQLVVRVRAKDLPTSVE